MELKHLKYAIDKANVSNLLIVPYGIETDLPLSHTYINPLLIVPYGIETSEKYKRDSDLPCF